MLDNFVRSGKTIGLFLKRNSSLILTGLGAAGVVSTAVLAGRAAVKAHEEIGHYEDLMECKLPSEELKTIEGTNIHYYEASVKEKVMLTWKYFVPPVAMGAISVASIIGAQSVNTRRHAALASLYTLTEQNLQTYREKIVENFKEKGLEKVEEGIDQDHISKNPPTESIIVLPEEAGEITVYDTVSGRYFKSDMETLRRIQNDINKEVIDTMWVSLNDFYCILGLDEIKIGEDLGWAPDKLMDIRFGSTLTEKGKPIMVIDYEINPFNYL